MTTTWIILGKDACQIDTTGVIGGIVVVVALGTFISLAIFRRVKYGAVF